MTSKQFMELAQLCPDHTLLGNNLLSTAKSLSTTEQPTTTSMNTLNPILSFLASTLSLAHVTHTFPAHNCAETFSDLIIQIELLIRAHDCFTLGCCVDGIAEVLTVSQQWVKERLTGGKHFKLMVCVCQRESVSNNYLIEQFLMFKMSLCTT